MTSFAGVARMKDDIQLAWGPRAGSKSRVQRPCNSLMRRHVAWAETAKTVTDPSRLASGMQLQSAPAARSKCIFILVHHPHILLGDSSFMRPWAVVELVFLIHAAQSCSVRLCFPTQKHNQATEGRMHRGVWACQRRRAVHDTSWCGWLFAGEM